MTYSTSMYTVSLALSPNGWGVISVITDMGSDPDKVDRVNLDGTEEIEISVRDFV